MLAILLDAGVPESEAVTPRGTEHRQLCFRDSLAPGKLDSYNRAKNSRDAIGAVDDSGELQWRLANAVHGHEGFLRSLQGWHDTLDAKAYQQEQAASQVLSTMLIILNGVLVSIVALAVFQPIIAVINVRSYGEAASTRTRFDDHRVDDGAGHSRRDSPATGPFVCG